MKKLLFIFLLCPLLAFSQQDWKATTEANTLTYVPAGLPANKEFQLKFYRINPDGISKKTWLIQHAKEQQSALGKITKNWKVKAAKKGEWVVRGEYITASGNKLGIGYETGTLANGAPYVYRVISSLDLGVLLKYGIKTKKLISHAEKELMTLQAPAVVTTSKTSAKPKNPAPIASATSQEDEQTTPDGLVSPSVFKKMTGKKRRQYIWRHIRTQPGQGVDLSSVETVLVNLGYSQINNSVTSRTYLLFKDGTVYKNCTTPIEDLNIEVSKQLEGPAYSKSPKWARWKKEQGKYYIQNAKGSEWIVLKNIQKALPGKKGERLDNTFWTFSSSYIISVSHSYREYYKFLPNGRFEIFNSTMNGGDMGDIGIYTGAVNTSDKTGTTGTTVIIGEDVGGGTSSRRKDGNKNTGTYYIDGYTIELHHDNGLVRRELFHFPSKYKRKYILLGNRIYWITDSD